MNTKVIRKFAVVGSAFAIALAIGNCASAQKYDSSSQPTNGITVVGSAEIKSKPDTVYVTLGVTTQDAVAAKAAQANANIANAIINAVGQLGIAKSDMQTTDYSVSPVMDYKKNPAAVVGYSVSNNVKVKVKDVTKVGPIIDAATKAGANDVEGVDFATEDNAKIKDKALREAAKDAQAKAEALADTLGVKLGKAISIEEISSPSPRPLQYAANAKMMDAATPIISGEVSSTANVRVVFSIL